jgi:hypothetical protein
MNEFLQTDSRRASTLRAIAKRAENSKGLERDAHKPLMRKRTAALAFPDANTARNTFLK